MGTQKQSLKSLVGSERLELSSPDSESKVLAAERTAYGRESWNRTNVYEIQRLVPNPLGHLPAKSRRQFADHTTPL